MYLYVHNMEVKFFRLYGCALGSVDIVAGLVRLVVPLV
jgi:hypothetical protein